MSLERMTIMVKTIAEEVLRRVRIRAPLFNAFRILPATYKLGARVVLKKPPITPARLSRMSKLILRNGRLYRPFSSALIEKHRFSRDGNKIRKFTPYVRRAKRHTDFIDNVKNVFRSNQRYNEDLAVSDLPTQISDYEFGQFLGQGCNASVYAARLNMNTPSTSRQVGLNDVGSLLKQRETFPYAIKLMYNFQQDIVTKGDFHIWQDMGLELTPYPKSADLLRGKIAKFQPLPRTHPNIVRVMTAFVDVMRVDPELLQRYPDEINFPTFMQPSDPRTLYVVMRRYRQNLRDYVWLHKRNYWTSRVMLAQLLEGCAYLQDHCVAHRDMKSDNILLEYDSDDEIPHLVISDFGCALANGSWEVPFEFEYDGLLGGNLRTRAPEVVTATPGKGKVVNFKMADTWAAGGLAYEMLTRQNPFYQKISSKDYLESDLPKLPSRVHHVTKDVVLKLLKRNPEQRISPHVAATAINLSLFQLGDDIKKLLAECGITKASHQLEMLGGNGQSKAFTVLKNELNCGLDKFIGLLAVETITSNLAPHLVSRAEKQLRATFLSRMTRDNLWSAIKLFFAEPHLSRHTSLGSGGLTDSTLSSLDMTRPSVRA